MGLFKSKLPVLLIICVFGMQMVLSDETTIGLIERWRSGNFIEA